MKFIAGLPNWARKFGIVGILLFLIVEICRFMFQEIASFEIQSWWNINSNEVIIPLLETKITFPLWKIIVIFLASLITVAGSLIVIVYVRKRVISSDKDTYSSLKSLAYPVDLNEQTLNYSDVINAIVDTRKKRMEADHLAKILITAVTNKVIPFSTAAKSLEEFDYQLVQLGDGSYTVSKLGPKNER